MGLWKRKQAPGASARRAIEAEVARRRPYAESLDDDRRPEDVSPSDLASVERLGTTFVVTVNARELRGLDARVLFAHLTERVVSEHARRFVFDLQSVEVMDSACVGAMVEMQSALQDEGGRIALVNPSEHIVYLLRLTRLDRLFPVCRDVMSAISDIEKAA